MKLNELQRQRIFLVLGVSALVGAAALCLVGLFGVACQNFDTDALRVGESGKMIGNEVSYKVIVIDGCEYIATSSAYGHVALIHKGNCKNHTRGGTEDVLSH
jgi:hypothetical protein